MVSGVPVPPWAVLVLPLSVGATSHVGSDGDKCCSWGKGPKAGELLGVTLGLAKVGQDLQDHPSLVLRQEEC